MGTGTGWTQQRPPPSSSSSPSLPPDILREVLARCDDETLVRCAASSKLLCRCMLDDPAFLRRRRRRATAGFAPSLLLGVLHSPIGSSGTRFLEAPAGAIAPPLHPIRSFFSNDGDDLLLRRFDRPVACRAGLLVLRERTDDDRAPAGRRRRRPPPALCVCDPMTGRRRILPPPEIDFEWLTILTGDDDDDDATSSSSSFQLLAMAAGAPVRWDPVVQLFTSPDPFGGCAGAWGPVTGVTLPGRFGPTDPAVVIRRAAHWLTWDDGHDVVALHAADARAELIKGLPAEHRRRRSAAKQVSVVPIALARTADRRLSQVVVDELAMSSVFVLSEDGRRWERRAEVVREGVVAPPAWVRVGCFGERSGTVVLCAGDHGTRLRYVKLNLETNQVASMALPAEEESLSWPYFVYEMDLPALIAALLMKSPTARSRTK